MNSINEIPSSILTPQDSTLPFFSFSIKQKSLNDQTVVKFFSHQLLKDEDLHLIFTNAKFVYRKSVEAYPRLPVKNELSGDFEVSDGLFFVNGMEEFISTMETEAVSGFNVAMLLKKREMRL